MRRVHGRDRERREEVVRFLARHEILRPDHEHLIEPVPGEDELDPQVRSSFSPMMSRAGYFAAPNIDSVDFVTFALKVSTSPFSPFSRSFSGFAAFT